MANANAVIIRIPKLYKVPTKANLSHNSGFSAATYWLDDGSTIFQNTKFNSEQDIENTWERWIADLKKKYIKSHKRAVKRNAVLIEEGLIVFGSDVQATENEILSILVDFSNKFSNYNNTKILHMAYHNHEGHIKDHIKIKNRHAHFLFANVSNDGIMIRRNWKRDYFKKLQDDIYEISKKYILNIERGEACIYDDVEINGKIVKISTKRQQHHAHYRKQKQLESIRFDMDKTLNDEIRILKDEISQARLKIVLQENKIVDLKKLTYSDIKYSNSEDMIPFKELFSEQIKLHNSEIEVFKNIQQHSDIQIEKLIKENNLFEKQVEELKKLVYSDVKIIDSDKFATYKEVASFYKNKHNEINLKINDFSLINSKLEKLQNLYVTREKIEKTNLTDFVSLIYDEIFKIGSLKQEIETLSSEIKDLKEKNNHIEKLRQKDNNEKDIENTQLHNFIKKLEKQIEEYEKLFPKSEDNQQYCDNDYEECEYDHSWDLNNLYR